MKQVHTFLSAERRDVSSWGITLFAVRKGEGGTFSTARGSAYGEADSTDHQSLTTDHLFTGKPYVEGLGHAFLLRNYRADLGKWQTADPLGHPDGWNNFAYCNGRVTSAVDWMGGVIIKYRDLNNYNVFTNPNNLSVSASCQSGDSAFTYSLYNIAYDSVAQQAVITVNVYLWVNFLQFDIQSLYCEYQPHVTANGAAGFLGGFYEVILAHEKGHANYFFGTMMSAFISYLAFLNVDSGNYGSQLSQKVREAWDTIINNNGYKTGINQSADQAVYNYFSSSIYWVQQPDNGTHKVWRKYE